MNTLFSSITRKINTKTWEFTDSNRGVSGVVHHTISAEAEDNDKEKIACTHAIVKACYGDTHAIDDRVNPDQDTQTAAVYCAMALLGTETFLDFARKINFLDEVSDLTKQKKA